MQSLVIIGRRWFDRVNGNTYHTSEVIVDGACVHKTDRHYGYGEQYLQTALDWLEKNGYLPGIEHHENGSTEALWHYCRERMGIAFTYSVSDVKRKKDL